MPGMFGPGLHGGSTPFLSSAGTCSWPAPSQLGEGRSLQKQFLREVGHSEVAAVLAVQEGPGKICPPRQLRRPRRRQGVPGGAVVEPPHTWRLVSEAGSAGSGRMEASPTRLPFPAQPDRLRDRDRLSGRCPMCGSYRRAEALPLQQPCLPACRRLSQASTLSPFWPAAPSTPQLSSSAGLRGALRPGAWCWGAGSPRGRGPVPSSVSTAVVSLSPRSGRFWGVRLGRRRSASSWRW